MSDLVYMQGHQSYYDESVMIGQSPMLEVDSDNTSLGSSKYDFAEDQFNKIYNDSELEDKWGWVYASWSNNALPEKVRWQLYLRYLWLKVFSHDLWRTEAGTNQIEWWWNKAATPHKEKVARMGVKETVEKLVNGYANKVSEQGYDLPYERPSFLVRPLDPQDKLTRIEEQMDAVEFKDYGDFQLGLTNGEADGTEPGSDVDSDFGDQIITGSAGGWIFAAVALGFALFGGMRNQPTRKQQKDAL